jgi:aldehyde:ferredoxin oxidoreductase
LYRRIEPGIDPFDPDNVLVISRGLLTGRVTPSSSRIHINALSPLSGLIGSSNVGGYIGFRIYSLGVHSIIITGWSEYETIIDLGALYDLTDPEALMYLSNLCNILGMDTISIIGDLSLGMEVRLIRTITGLDISPEALVSIGERIVHMEKIFNIRRGSNPDDDSLPDLFLKSPIEKGSFTRTWAGMKTGAQGKTSCKNLI